MLLTSWVPVPESSEFSLNNLPYGVFAPSGSTNRRCATVIGETLVDLSLLEEASLFDDISQVAIFRGETLNPFLECVPAVWRAIRKRLIDLLAENGADPRLRDNHKLQQVAFRPLEKATMYLPIQIGDYTDFYSSREHATNVGTMFRGKDNALQPNWLHLPVGYHGRSSTIYVSGHSFPRPMGQIQKNQNDPSEGSIYGPSKLLDFELEIATVVGGPPNNGQMNVAQAKERIFGFMLMNDWSARDIQKWEYVPLGPFTSKNFATTVSPWIVSAEALAPFQVPTSAGVQVDPEPHEYLRDPDYSSYDIQLTVAIQPNNDDSMHVVSKSNFLHLYWNPPQQLAHHSVTGCIMKAGDLLGSGTISGTGPDSFGSLLELSWKGTKEIPVGDGTRKFLQDGDSVIMRGCCEREGHGLVGFGECRATILPVLSKAPFNPCDRVSLTKDKMKFRLFGFWKSSSTWRVRMVLDFKGIPYETIPVDLTTKENLAESYTSKNSKGQVPMLECTDMDTGKVLCLTQSIAIVEFLEDVMNETRSIFPKDVLQRAKVREMVEIVNSGIQPLQNVFYLERLEERSGGAIKANVEARDNISKGLAHLEGLAKGCQQEFLGPFCAGTFSPSLADFCVVAQLANARRCNVDVGRVCPTLLKVENACMQTDWYRSSQPESQPDFRI